MFIPLENKENNEAELERKKQCNLLCTLLWSLFFIFLSCRELYRQLGQRFVRAASSGKVRFRPSRPPVPLATGA
jgi:hypothetical protein